MAKIGLLTNRTRAVQRPPLLQTQVSAGMLARLLPVIQRPKKPTPAKKQPDPPRTSGQAQAQQQARSEQPVRRKPVVSRSLPRQIGQPESQHPNQNGKPSNAPLPNGNLPNGTRPAAEQPKSNQVSKPQSSSHNPPAPNNTPLNGKKLAHSDIFGPGRFTPASPDRLEREDRKPARPVQIPFENPAKPGENASNPNAGKNPPGAQNPLNRDQPVSNGASKIAPNQPPRLPDNPGQANRPASNNSRSYPASSQPPRAQKPQPHLDLVPALKRLFRQQAGLPAHAALLGVGEDQYPVLLDLYDPAPGALVVIGDERKQQLDMLRSAVASLAMRGTPRSVQVMILSCEPETWRTWMAEQGFERFIAGIEGVEDLDNLRDWILKLGDWIEQRRLGQRSGPPILLVMDTLSFLPRLSHDIRLNFDWMIKEGPAAQIWPLAAISSELAQLLSGRHLLGAFQTRVLGFVDRPDFYVQFAHLTLPVAQEFAQPGVFAVQVGEDWLRMRVVGS